jgi:GTP cyclohydrolase II
MAIHTLPMITPDDSALLEALTGPANPTQTAVRKRLPRRDAALDPLLLAATAASGPHVTRNHYQHDFYPVMDPRAEGAWDWTKWKAPDASTKEPTRLAYVSRQAPRRQRLAKELKENGETAVNNQAETPLQELTQNITLSPKKRQVSTALSSPPVSADLPELEVKCMARTRIPTPHGPVFLHLYHNNRDNKEHLALVVDPAQLSDELPFAPPIRSRTLDAVWSDDETEMDRITRGAYVGRLSSNSQKASTPSSTHESHLSADDIPAPLIRIHSECFTGETVGSMRCDCGEQLDEAIRLISQPIVLSSDEHSTATIPGRGVVVYMRQEGRGIGLLSKIRAYNLQDLGHDTVTANLMLGHKADERGYEIACAILRDLGMGTEQDEGVCVLTNNPDKVQALEKEGLRVVERVPMVPRSWQQRHQHAHNSATDDGSDKTGSKNAGATLIGGGAVHGPDLDKYLHTKVTRMGHMLPLWMQGTDEL